MHDLKFPKPIYTDAYLYDKDTLQEIEKFREAIFGGIHDRANDMPTEWELVLDPAEDEGPDVCYYYFVNRSNRTLFWLHKFDMTSLLHNLPPVKPKSNRRIRESKFPTPLVVLVSNLQP